MAATPLYKFLKNNATTFYCFPSSASDISSAYMNGSYKMYFSKYVLLNLPKKSNVSGQETWNFDSAFIKSPNATPAANYSDEVVESLRNYVANHEVTMKEAKLNNTEYYYNNNDIQTSTEKIFWKWCRKLNLIDFDLAIPNEEYFDNLNEFARKNPNDDEYFPEYLWTERKINDYRFLYAMESDITGYVNMLQLEYDGLTNYKVGDTLSFKNVTFDPILNDNTLSIVYVYKTSEGNHRIIFDYPYTGAEVSESTGQSTLIYNKLVQYIGEVNGISNVSLNNRNYTEVYAHIPDHTGQTPDILFRTMADTNYKPNLSYPILPSQYQPEIVGAEFFNSPIVTNPQNYPGSYYGQFDTEDYVYETSIGDSERRSGDYYGLFGDIIEPSVNSNNIDGVCVDFDQNHYVKMNIIGNEMENFDQFNALEVNNQPPKDFEFNAILWYYTVEDVAGNKASNLYGISFLDNPKNNQNVDEIGIKFPVYKKLVATDDQNGTSYAFNLDLNFNIINDNPQDTYNPDAINSMFNFNLYNEAIARLVDVNDSFNKIMNDNLSIHAEILNLKQLLYTQTDIATINYRINNLSDLLKLYSSNQLVDSDTITVSVTQTGEVPYIQLENVDRTYSNIYNINTKNLYNNNATEPMEVVIPNNKNLLINIINNDDNNIALTNNSNLSIVLSKDLVYKQSIDINIDGTDLCTQNKKLDIYINYLNDSSPIPVTTALVTNIDLPIYYNLNTQKTNYSRNSNSMNIDVDLTKDIEISSSGILKVPFNAPLQLIQNTFKIGDYFYIDNFDVKASLTSNDIIKFSGQYIVNSIDTVESVVYFNLSNNTNIISYVNTSYSFPFVFNGPSTYVLCNKPVLKLNKGVKFKLICLTDDTTSSISNRYLIQKFIN